MVGAIALMHDAHTKYKNAEYTKKAKLVAASPSICSAVFCLYEIGRHCFICVATFQLSPPNCLCL